MAQVSGLGVAYAAGGFVLVYSGLKNTTLRNTLGAFLQGKLPAPQLTGEPSIGLQQVGSPSGSASGSGATGSAIADDALKYQGKVPYVWGGSSTKGWDCSGFVNYVLNHDLGMAIPGAAAGSHYSGHGPTTLSYLSWGGAETIGKSPSSAAAGDLCVWQTHMGIATGGGNMISALDEQLGTRVTSISGGAPGGEQLYVRRINAAQPPPPLAGRASGTPAPPPLTG